LPHPVDRDGHPLRELVDGNEDIGPCRSSGSKEGDDERSPDERETTHLLSPLASVTDSGRYCNSDAEGNAEAPSRVHLGCLITPN
jgi:hypothetical protein